MHELNIEQLIDQALQGEQEALNTLLGRYRAYLRLLAENALEPTLRRREDASDIVQKTLFKVYDDFQTFHGSSEMEFSAWLKQILRRNIANAYRYNQAAKRDVRRETNVDDPLGSASVQWWFPAKDQSSPSVRILKAEAALNLAEAIDHLPADQRTAVQLRHLEGQSMDQIAQSMDRSPIAVAGLLRRGLVSLRGQAPAAERES